MGKKPASAAAEVRDYRGEKIRPKARQMHSAASAPALHVVTKTMRPSDIVAVAAGSDRLMAEYGLHCFNCSANTLETLEEGCLGHGFEQDEIDELVDDINRLIAEQPKRPKTLTITKAAAEAVRDIAAKENRKGGSLAVIADRSGGFCMEFRKEILREDHRFAHREVSDITVTASAATLQTIGGATIDFREGRFKLDLAENAACGCGNGQCECTARME